MMNNICLFTGGFDPVHSGHIKVIDEAGRCINTTMKINLLPPALIFYTSKFKREDWQAAIAKGPLVFIRPKYEDDKALLNHELFHVFQWWVTLGAHPLWYTFVPKYRYWSEIYAYRRQLRKYPENLDLYAGYIADHYNLNVTAEQAKQHLVNN